MSEHFPIMVPGAVAAKTPLTVTAPYDGVEIATVETGGADAAEAALATAYGLYRDRDAWLGAARRIEILGRAADLMHEQREYLAIESAREGGKPIVILLDESLCGRLQEIYREEAEGAGRSVKRGTELALGGQLILTENSAQVPDILGDTQWFWNTWGIPFGLGTPEQMVGHPDEVSRTIEKAMEIGTDEMFFLIGDGLFPRDTILRTLELFATKVMPRFQ